jgi:hypothetical protein
MNWFVSFGACARDDPFDVHLDHGDFFCFLRRFLVALYQVLGKWSSVRKGALKLLHYYFLRVDDIFRDRNKNIYMTAILQLLSADPTQMDARNTIDTLSTLIDAFIAQNDAPINQLATLGFFARGYLVEPSADQTASLLQECFPDFANFDWKFDPIYDMLIREFDNKDVEAAEKAKKTYHELVAIQRMLLNLYWYHHRGSDDADAPPSDDEQAP